MAAASKTLSAFDSDFSLSEIDRKVMVRGELRAIRQKCSKTGACLKQMFWNECH